MPNSTRSARQHAREEARSEERAKHQRTEKKQPPRSHAAPKKSLTERLPGFAVPAAIAVVVIVVLVVVFAVIVPSCSQSDEPAQTGTSSTSSSSSDSSSSGSSSSQSAADEGIVSMVSHAIASTRTSSHSAAQVEPVNTSNSNVEELVSLLGEEEAGKLLAQAKTDPDALWIASHVDEYAFDGIEIQYKILKLAADEPEAIPYVREFPAKYPMADAVEDKDLAMGIASPSSSVPTTSVPHLYQWDRRWAYTIYSSATFGLTGCGPASLAMVYQGLNKTTDRTPHDMAVLAEENGYMSEFNGTDSAFFINMAPELGLDCWESYPDAANIRDELSKGRVIIANLQPGFFTVGGHFFVLAGLDDDGKVIVNDPYSVERSSQTWDADFIASESRALFVYAKA